MRLDELVFNEKKGYLMDKSTSKRYNCKRIGTISAYSSSGYSTPDLAIASAIRNTTKMAEELGAMAFEIITTQTLDSLQEYDTSPWTAQATAIIYRKNHPQ